MGGRRRASLEVDGLREGCLRTLRALGKTVSAQVVAIDESSTLKLKLGVNAARLNFEVRVTRSHLSYPLATGLMDEAKRGELPWLLFAPYVPSRIGHHLQAQQVNYVDAVGNCHIETEGLLVAHVEGKKAIRELSARAPGVKAQQLLFALLAQPELVEAPVRKIALAAGIGKSATLEQLGRLNVQGLLDYHPATGLISRRDLLDRWLSAYADEVRPSWLNARCRSQVSDPHALEAMIERICEGQSWALGGIAAASRMAPMVNRGTETVLHLAEIPAGLLEQLQAVPTPDGPITILHTPGTLAYQGIKPRLAHPLLVYSELLTSTEPQAAQAANSVRDQFLTNSREHGAHQHTAEPAQSALSPEHTEPRAH